MKDVPPVSAVADVLALRGLDGWLTPPLAPVVAAPQPVAGRALTLQLDVAENGRAGLGGLHELASRPLGGGVLVLAGGGCVDGAVWGEIMSRAARACGAVAVLVDGAVRDRVAMAREGLPVYAAGERVVGPRDLVRVRDEGQPVEVAGVRIAPGDLVVADENGVVRVPAERADEILEAAGTYAAGEARVLDALAEGERLVHGYRHKREVVAGIRRAGIDGGA